MEGLNLGRCICCELEASRSGFLEIDHSRLIFILAEYFSKDLPFNTNLDVIFLTGALEKTQITSRNSCSGGWKMGFVRRGRVISRE